MILRGKDRHTRWRVERQWMISGEAVDNYLVHMGRGQNGFDVGVVEQFMQRLACLRISGVFSEAKLVYTRRTFFYLTTGSDLTSGSSRTIIDMVASGGWLLRELPSNQRLPIFIHYQLVVIQSLGMVFVSKSVGDQGTPTYGGHFHKGRFIYHQIWI